MLTLASLLAPFLDDEFYHPLLITHSNLQTTCVQVAAGAVPVSGGRSWQLIDCAPVDPRGPGGVKALQALKQNLSDVLEVMLPAFGKGGRGVGACCSFVYELHMSCRVLMQRQWLEDCSLLAVHSNRTSCCSAAKSQQYHHQNRTCSCHIVMCLCVCCACRPWCSPAASGHEQGLCCAVEEGLCAADSWLDGRVWQGTMHVLLQALPGLFRSLCMIKVVAWQSDEGALYAAFSDAWCP